MAERKFTLIKGGLSYPHEDGNKTFVSSFVTDTRLMGVVGLYIRWNIRSSTSPTNFHQFFYFDVEEYGFETYRSISSDDATEIELIEQTLLGGLGGKKNNLTEKEATFLLQSYVEVNRKLSTALPEGESEYEFLLEPKIEMTEKEELVLFQKQCSNITSTYQAINYFLMRCFGKDFVAAKFLAHGEFPLNIYDDIPIATLCKNTIDSFKNENGISYLCESLVENDASYMLVISEITVSDYKITSFEKRSSMQISAVEAAMMLSRSEFVTVYEILDDSEEFDVGFMKLTAGALITMHDSGKLFLVFNKTNEHVSKQVFRLNEDVYGLYYITDMAQLIVAAYSEKEVHAIEKEIQKSSIAKFLIPSSKYEFKEPVLYEFVQSGFDDFDDFLDFIK